MLRLLACDIDGTLMPYGERKLDPAIFPVIERLINCGIEFVTCSGRQYANQRRLFAPIADKIGYICENGSLSMKDGLVVGCDTLERSKVLALIALVQSQPNCEVLLSTQKCCYVQTESQEYVNYVRDFVGNDVEVVSDLTALEEECIKLSAYCKDGTVKQTIERLRRYSEPYVTPVSGGNQWIDFLKEDSNKGIALKEYCKQRGVPLSDCVAIGDNQNDLSLIGCAGEVWAMRTGHPDLIAQADRVIDSVSEELIRLTEERR